MTEGLTVLVIHERYQQFGGEDVAVDADLALLEAHGHRVVYYERHNDEIKGLGLVGRTRVAAGAVWSVSSVKALEHVIGRARPDIVHVHNTFPLISPAAYRAAARRGIPVVQTVQNYRMVCAVATLLRDGHVCVDCVGRRLPLPAIRHACYHNSRVESAIVAAMQVTHRTVGTWGRDVSLYLPSSHHVLRRLVGAGAFPETKAMVRRNHVSPDPGAREPGSDKGYVAFAGRLSVEKGVEVLVRAAALVPDIPVRIVGDGPQRAELTRVARELGATNVTFLGQLARPQAMEVVRGARCLAFPSTWEEPMGLVLIEAAAQGVPAIGTDVGGAPECIGAGAGRLVPPGNVEALADALREAAADPDDWWRRGRAARRHFEEEFTAERAYEVLATAYRRVGVPVTS